MNEQYLRALGLTDEEPSWRILKMVELIIVRHGQSVADIEGRHEGRADFPLTELGREQATKAAEWIAQHYPPDLVIASPLKRAAETATLIANRCEVKLRFDNDLMEMNNGVLAGLLFSEAKEKYPLPPGGRKDYDPVPEGESALTFRARVEGFWARFEDEYLSTMEQKRICIVAHGGTIAMLYRAFLQLPMKLNYVFPTGDTGIHIWRIKDHQRVVLHSNVLEHLR